MQIHILLVAAQHLFHHAPRILHIQLHAIQHIAAVEDAVVQALYNRVVRVSISLLSILYSTYWRHAGRAVLHKTPTALLKCIKVQSRPSTTVANHLQSSINKYLNLSIYRISTNSHCCPCAAYNRHQLPRPMMGC